MPQLLRSEQLDLPPTEKKEATRMGFVANMIALIASALCITLVLIIVNTITPTLADNLAEMALEAVQKDLRGLYHASGSQRISRYEFAKQTAKAFNLDQNLIQPIKMSRLAVWVAKRPRDSSLNTEKIQKQLKTKPLNVTEGLNRMKKEAET